MSRDLVALFESAIRGTNSEDYVQVAIERLLLRLHIDHEREARLSKTERIDFLVGTEGVEVKVQGSVDAVIRQLTRYAKSERVSSLILVTSKVTLARVPSELNGKPVRVAALLGGIL